MRCLCMLVTEYGELPPIPSAQQQLACCMDMYEPRRQLKAGRSHGRHTSLPRVGQDVDLPLPAVISGGLGMLEGVVQLPSRSQGKCRIM